MTQEISDDFTKVEIVHLFGIPIEKLPTYNKKSSVGDAPTERHKGLNIPLLLDIMNFIKEHPTTWYQDDWFMVVDRETGSSKFISDSSQVEEINSCGTSFCFAGHVALAEGFPAPPKNNYDLWHRNVKYPNYEQREMVDEFARLRLGLTTSQADALFGSGNEMIDLERMVHALILVPKVPGYILEDIKDIDTDDDKRFMSFLLEIAEQYNHKD